MAACGGNWLDSRMARLAGQFAGILLVEVPDERVEDLSQALDGLAAHGLRVMVEPSSGPSPGPTAGTQSLQLELVGQDRPGIVRQVARLLAARGVNVEELATSRLSAPMSGELLFRAQVRLLAPSTVSAADLRADLESLAHDLMVDVTLFDP